MGKSRIANEVEIGGWKLEEWSAYIPLRFIPFYIFHGKRLEI